MVENGKGVYIRAGSGTNAVTEHALLQVDRFSGAQPVTLFMVDGKTGITYGRRVKVNLSAWADYVFEPGYIRMTPEEKEKYYNEHKHLVGIAPGKEIEEDGLDIGETMKGITMNVEENSLEIIDLYKRLLVLEKENKILKEQVNKLIKKQ